MRGRICHKIAVLFCVVVAHAVVFRESGLASDGAEAEFAASANVFAGGKSVIRGGFEVLGTFRCTW